MSRHVREARSVSLFPFLAVLICAMGALIFLLVVTTRRIRHQAIMQVQQVTVEEVVDEDFYPPVLFSAEFDEPEVASPPVTEPAVIPEPQVINLALEQETRLKELRRKKAIRLARLKSHNLNLIRLKNELSQSEDSLEANLQQTQLLRQQDAELSQKMDQIQQQKLRVAELLQEELRNLQQKKQLQKTARSKFSVIPYDGQTGTSKRPILIECTDSGLTFIPEGITLTPDDLKDFTPGYNPLLSGTQALVQYWKNKDQGSSQGPYVLILVRPSGSVGYYVARKLLNNLKLDSGYELVDADWEFELPQKDLNAEQVCQAAIDRIMSERKKLVSQLRQHQTDPGGRKLQFDARTGTVRVIESENTSDTGAGARGRSGNTAENQQTETAGVSRFSDVLTQRQKIVRAKYLKQHENKKHIVGRGGSGSSESESDGLSSDPDSKQAKSGNEGPGKVPGSRSSAEVFSLSDLKKPTGEYTGTSSGLKHAKVMDREQLKRQAEQHFVTLNGAQEKQSSHKQNGEGQKLSSKASSENRLIENPFVKTGNQKESTRSSQSTQKTGSSQDQPRSKQKTPGQSASGAGNSKSSFSFNQSQRAGGAQSEIESSEHRQWQPPQSRSGIGFEREISVQVGAEQIIVGEGKVVNLNPGISQEELLQSMIVMMDQHLKSWGPAPKGFYWVPTIRFAVSPGGNQFYERLKLSAQKMGLQTVAKFTLDPLPVTSPSVEEQK